MLLLQLHLFTCLHLNDSSFDLYSDFNTLFRFSFRFRFVVNCDDDDDGDNELR